MNKKALEVKTEEVCKKALEVETEEVKEPCRHCDGPVPGLESKL